MARSRGLGDVYKRQAITFLLLILKPLFNGRFRMLCIGITSLRLLHELR
jgi:hypothetical protein